MEGMPTQSKSLRRKRRDVQPKIVGALSINRTPINQGMETITQGVNTNAEINAHSCAHATLQCSNKMQLKTQQNTPCE